MGDDDKSAVYMYIHKQTSKHDEFSEPLEAHKPEKSSTIFRHQKVVIILNSICKVLCCTSTKFGFGFSTQANSSILNHLLIMTMKLQTLCRAFVVTVCEKVWLSIFDVD